MTNQEINKAIAEACGWHEEPEPEGSYNATAWWHKGDRYPSNAMPVPDYCNDLNAMNEAENDAFPYPHYPLCGRYTNELESICERDKTRRCSATARQRAEAFLRTIGKWEQEETK